MTEAWNKDVYLSTYPLAHTPESVPSPEPASQPQYSSAHERIVPCVHGEVPDVVKSRLPIWWLHAQVADNGMGEVAQLLFQLRAEKCRGKDALVGGGMGHL